MKSTVPRLLIAEPCSSVKTLTGSWRTFKPVVDKEKCTACTLCASYCPEGVITVGKEEKAVIDYQYCKGCALCAEVCPVSAVSMQREVRA